MFYVCVYISAIVLANLSVAAFGPLISPINAFLFIGLDLSLRDKLHDRWKNEHLWWRMGSMISAAGLISYLLNPAAAKIAIASAVSFVFAAIVDTIVYQLLKHKTYLQRSNGSNVAGAFVDSLIFPALAFGGFLWHITLLQFAAKVFGGAVWSWAFRKIV